jgi:AcrR family transcriptional regulator
MREGSPHAAPPGRDRRYHHGDLRAALLASAEAELEERGIEAFSLRSVAKRAGVSHAAPAHHFGDVNGLLTALAAEGFRQFLAAQRRREAQAGPAPEDQLVAAGLGYVAFARDRPALFRLIFNSERPDFGHPDLALASREAFQHLVDQVRAIAGRDPRTDAAAMLDVAGLWSVVHGIADLMASRRLPVARLPEAEQEAAIAALILRMIPHRGR